MQYLGEVRSFLSSHSRSLLTRSPQIIPRDESYRRVLTTYKDSKSYYFLDYDGHEVIDAVRSSLSASPSSVHADTESDRDNAETFRASSTTRAGPTSLS